ncbi:hypothetical protein P691DRAFT_550994 [Macrolepiota fuliginosa MF-IS2]|uniref:Uncharacterized protein n=1 Tax=Macrolepiota fuliginosa MF-IS2 TaxID=1400762 RepID=A0A9P5XDT7_9AGAR|nr:hypothetical protein P691DRAFT_550994 [Macrolepiota fuliginosa MF-IS2]
MSSPTPGHPPALNNRFIISLPPELSPLCRGDRLPPVPFEEGPSGVQGSSIAASNVGAGVPMTTLNTGGSGVQNPMIAPNTGNSSVQNTTAASNTGGSGIQNPPASTQDDS